MEYKPHTYQKALIQHGLKYRRCAFWAGMGTGKTSSAATVANALYRGGEVEKALIIAPRLVAATVWPEEVKKWDHLKDLNISPILGTPYQRHQALARNAELYTINYDNVPWLIETIGAKWPFQLVIADEATKLKNFRIKQGTKRAGALGKVAGKTPFWLNLTGTPTPNGLLDLWGQTWFLDAGARLGRTHEAFINRWFIPNRNGNGYTARDHAFKEITDLLSDICYSVEAKDFLNLPPLIEKFIYVDLPTKARRHYDDMEADLFTEFESRGVEAFSTAAAMNKCLQIAGGACYTDTELKTWENVHDEKLDALADVLDEAGGMPLLVAYQYKHDLVKLLKRFPQGRALDKNPGTIDAFNAGKIPLLFAHPQSAGHGLNLQHGSNIIVFYNSSWNYEHHAQIIERIGPTRQRQSGYNRPVYVVYIVGRDTLENEVIDRLKGKGSLEAAVMGRMKRRDLAA